MTIVGVSRYYLMPKDEALELNIGLKLAGSRSHKQWPGVAPEQQRGAGSKANAASRAILFCGGRAEVPIVYPLCPTKSNLGLLGPSWSVGYWNEASPGSCCLLWGVMDGCTRQMSGRHDM